MSDGRKKNQPEMSGPKVVTLDQEEFNKVCRRVHTMLLSRSEKARIGNEKKPSKKAQTKHIETSKEVFVFVHLLELVENMTSDIADLRSIITSMSPDEDDDDSNAVRGLESLFAPSRKRFLN